MNAILDIEGFPGYTVSSDGRVFGPRGEMKGTVSPKGYLRVCLRRDGKAHWETIHKNWITA